MLDFLKSVLSRTIITILFFGLWTFYMFMSGELLQDMNISEYLSEDVMKFLIIILAGALSYFTVHSCTWFFKKLKEQKH